MNIRIYLEHNLAYKEVMEVKITTKLMKEEQLSINMASQLV